MLTRILSPAKSSTSSSVGVCDAGASTPTGGRSVIAAISVEVSSQTFVATPASREKFFAIFDGAFERGVAAITVHGRTVEQRYVGPSRWEFLREVKQHAGSRTVLGSGDLFSAQACLDMILQTGVDGVTVARGAIGNPWIFQQARALAAGDPMPDPPSLFEQRCVIAEHYRLASEFSGPESCGRQMRKFGIKYSRLHPDFLAVRDAFIAVKRPDELQLVLDRFYAEDLPGRHADADVDEVEGCESG